MGGGCQIWHRGASIDKKLAPTTTMGSILKEVLAGRKWQSGKDFASKVALPIWNFATLLAKSGKVFATLGTLYPPYSAAKVNCDQKGPFLVD